MATAGDFSGAGVDAWRDSYARKGVVNIETIKIDGVETVTRKELLIPGLRAVFVGINPSPISVAAGHYYQGRLGRRFWGRLQSAGIATDLSMGREDDAALEQGLGFADVVRRPTTRSTDVSDTEMSEGAENLVGRLQVAHGAVVVFVFKGAYDMAASRFTSSGWTVRRMPGPYDRAAEVAADLERLASTIG